MATLGVKGLINCCHTVGLIVSHYHLTKRIACEMVGVILSLFVAVVMIIVLRLVISLYIAVIVSSCCSRTYSFTGMPLC